jgi:hypothetical protein
MDGFKRSVYVNVGVILGSFLVFLGAIWFMGRLIQQSGVKLVDQFSNYFYQSYAAERLLTLKQLEPQARDFERKMEILLPMQDELLNFPDFMKNLANAHVVTLSLYYPGSITQPNGSAGSVSFSLNASGPLDNLQDFLDALENKTRQFWVGVDSVDFVRSGSTYALTAQGKVFFRAN